MTTIWTIGHSTRPLADILALLGESRIALVADVRSIPRSRRHPQYDIAVLPDELAAAGIGYVHLPRLGGRRRRGAGPSPNGLWRVVGFRNYADYALAAPFAEGLADLRHLADGRRTAILCAEAVWWRCHRRIIADWLLAGGDEVLHILGPSYVVPARLTPGAVIDTDGRVTYPAEP